MKHLSNVLQKHHAGLLAALVILTVGLGCETRSDEEWTRGLAHKKLSRASNSGSVSSKTSFYFCPGGEYAMVTDFSGFSTGGAGTLSMADQDVELGKWAVKNGTLYVQSQKGESRSYDLGSGSDSNVVTLNGNGYLVDTHRECEAP